MKNTGKKNIRIAISENVMSKILFILIILK
jgi:hypothetical protein